MPRGSDDSDRTALLGSAGIHAAAVVLALLSTFLRPEPLVFEAIAVEIVSMPDVQEPEPGAPDELVVETPDPTPPEPEPTEPDPVVEPEPEPRQPEPTPEPEPKPEPPKPTPPKPTPPKPTPTPEPKEMTGEDIDVHMEGLQRDFPEYYGNIVRQIRRCFRPPANARGEAVVQFFINRDGRASDLDLVTSSGSYALDLEARGAVECAGQGRFGPLPEDMSFDRLPVRFRFTPAGEDAPTEPGQEA